MEQQHHGGLEISPLLVGLLGVMAGALIVATLHCIIVCWCCDTESERSPARRRTIPTAPANSAAADYNREQATSSSGSFSNVLPVIITSNYNDSTSKEYSKEDDDICAVCLSEFNVGDEVRVLPECTHTFHGSCIDKWLHSHRNCPLCRAETLPS
ncbi:RING-H2 finger protein ATL51-like [Coffea eugenioides]|uniref:RING-H2 finger protein ATL51-like n=1 Tax=Coffea eugenioides TaxID=49369 RepID=UPI000F611D14|nr:RING-H2 finger protein ATL51-like [Coffea eugenioides]